MRCSGLSQFSARWPNSVPTQYTCVEQCLHLHGGRAIYIYIQFFKVKMRTNMTLLDKYVVLSYLCTYLYTKEKYIETLSFVAFLIWVLNWQTVRTSLGIYIMYFSFSVIRIFVLDVNLCAKTTGKCYMFLKHFIFSLTFIVYKLRSRIRWILLNKIQLLLKSFAIASINY